MLACLALDEWLINIFYLSVLPFRKLVKDKLYPTMGLPVLEEPDGVGRELHL